MEGRAYEMLVGLLEWMTERRKGCRRRFGRGKAEQKKIGSWHGFSNALFEMDRHLRGYFSLALGRMVGHEPSGDHFGVGGAGYRWAVRPAGVAGRFGEQWSVSYGAAAADYPEGRNQVDSCGGQRSGRLPRALGEDRKPVSSAPDEGVSFGTISVRINEPGLRGDRVRR